MSNSQPSQNPLTAANQTSAQEPEEHDRQFLQVDPTEEELRQFIFGLGDEFKEESEK